MIREFLKARREALNPAKFTFTNIKAVLQSFLRKERELVGIPLPPHIYEQIVWRRVMVEKNSPECLSSGACKVCGCDIYGKTMEDRGCSIGEEDNQDMFTPPCYPAMMEKGEWEHYKLINKIKYFL